MSTKTDKVKSYFENSSNYLGTDGRTIGILSRQKIIQSMLDGRRFQNMLDVPCGNGLISIPLIQQASHLTMVDISKSMVESARSNIPIEYANKVDVKLGDVFEMNLPKKAYDCILAIGILAHVDDPQDFLDEMDELLVPGGSLIIQTTDHSHFKIRLQKILRGGKELSQVGSYQLNSISHKWLTRQIKKKNYSLVSSYRYETKIPFLLSGQGTKGLEEIWRLYGRPPSNRFSFLGSKCLYHYQKNEKES